jgi:hypothetical protein
VNVSGGGHVFLVFFSSSQEDGHLTFIFFIFLSFISFILFKSLIFAVTAMDSLLFLFFCLPHFYSSFSFERYNLIWLCQCRQMECGWEEDMGNHKGDCAASCVQATVPNLILTRISIPAGSGLVLVCYLPDSNPARDFHLNFFGSNPRTRFDFSITRPYLDFPSLFLFLSLLCSNERDN